MDPELVRKLQARRGVVDSQGTSFTNRNPGTASGSSPSKASPASAFFSAARPPFGAVGGGGGGARTASRVDDAPTGSVVSELAKKLEARRGLVESQGGAWQKLPEERPGVDGGSAHLEAVPAAEAAEPRPWEELRRGARTWVCEVWLAEALRHPRASASFCRAGGSGGETSEEGGCADEPIAGGVLCGNSPAAAQPAVLCVGADGLIMCCVAAPAPPGVGEEVDYARLIASFSIASLVGLGIVPSAPQTIGFQVAAGDKPVVLARFESAGEAELCARAVAMVSPRPLPVLEGSPLELEGSEWERCASVATAASEDAGAAASSIASSTALHQRTTEVCCVEETPIVAPKLRAIELVSCKVGGCARDLEAETRAFLQELDRLSGFA